MRGATSEIIRPALADRPSIHAPHAWGDSLYHGGWRSIDKLQSTPHMRGATVCCSCSVLHRFTSIHAPHAWGDRFSSDKQREESITSIHAPHAWGDCLHGRHFVVSLYFNPRPTCVGRPLKPQSATGNVLLQSTSHMRGATAISQMASWLFALQSTPHMRGATP